MSFHVKSSLLIFLVIVLGTFPVFFQYGDYLFFSDFLNQQIPYIIETKRMLSSGSPLWSWNTYLGQNFIGAYSFYTLTSPFVWINCFFPEEYIIKSLFFTLILKFISAYLTSYFYFRKMAVSKDNSIIGGLLYTFSSYTITNLYYYHFFEPLIVFPLLLIALERFFRKERFCLTLLILASFLITFINFYFSICSFIAAAIYSLCRLFSEDVKIPFKRICLCVLCVSFGILLDAAVLFPSLAKVMGSTRVGGFHTGFDYTWKWVMLERLRNFIMPQIMEGPNSIFRYTGYGSTSLCIAVLGAFPAILYCFKNKKHWLTILFLVLVFLYVTPANSFFSLFTNANYTRWGYALCLVLILLSVKYLDYKIKPKKKYVVLYLIFAFLVCTLSIHRHGIEGSTESRCFLLSSYLFLFALNCVCLLIWTYCRNNKCFYIMFCLCVVIQMWMFYTIQTDIYQDFVKRSHGVFDSAEYGKIGKRISENFLNPNQPKLNGKMHYRNIFYGKISNAGLINNRASDISFHSVLNYESIRFTQTSDTVVHTENRMAHNCNFRSFYSLISVRDFVVSNSREKSLSFEGVKSSLYESNGDYSIYRNEDYIPMGFTYDSYVLDSEVDSVNKLKPKQDVPLLLLNHLSVSDKDEKLFAKYLKRGVVTTSVDIDSVIGERKKHHSLIFEGTTTGFCSEIELVRDNFVFYSIPHEAGFTAYVDSHKVSINEVNLGLSAVLVPKGKHRVEFLFIPKGLIPGAYISLGVLVFVIIIGYKEARDMKLFVKI